MDNSKNTKNSQIRSSKKLTKKETLFQLVKERKANLFKKKGKEWTRKELFKMEKLMLETGFHKRKLKLEWLLQRAF